MFVKIAAPLILAAGLASSASAQSSPTDQGPTLLLHGNYCGPGNNAPLPPIDALDAACARHDACTPSHGLASPACNARLQRDAASIAGDAREPEDVCTLAELVAVGAGILPSDPQARTPASVPTAQHTGAYASVAHRHTSRKSMAIESDDTGAE